MSERNPTDAEVAEIARDLVRTAAEAMAMSNHHADASPSSSSIWIKCPASVTKARGRSRKATVYTREGSAAHHVAELLIHGLGPPDEVYIEGETVEVDDDMIDNVEHYVEYVEKLRKDADVFMTETRVHLNGMPEPVHGTADVIAYWRKDRTLEVPDLKYGRGVLVNVTGNSQTRIYALGAINALGPFEPVDIVRMTIAQPRLTQGPSITSEELSVAELLAWESDVLLPANEKIAAGDETEIAGEHCRFCVRAGECHTLARLAQDSAKIVFGAVSTPDAGGLSNDELSAILDNAELILAWVNKVRTEASQRLDKGQTVSGWKLVAKRALRKWVDEDDALAALSKLGLPWAEITKAVSPAAVERVLKARKVDVKKLNPLVKKESSGTTLVREDDARDGVASDAKSVFGRLSLVS